MSSHGIRNEALDRVAEDLFSIPPLIARSIRRKLLREAFSGMPEGLSPPQLEIMKALDEAGSLHLTGIGERLLIPKPQMTHLIDRLATLGMVAREPDEHDRRSTNVVLTPRGQACLEEHRRLLKSAIRKTLSSLTDEELKELAASLRQLRETFQKLQQAEVTNP
jgi:DNA-binding MarR family transcriptional regulator